MAVLLAGWLALCTRRPAPWFRLFVPPLFLSSADLTDWRLFSVSLFDVSLFSLLLLLLVLVLLRHAECDQEVLPRGGEEPQALHLGPLSGGGACHHSRRQAGLRAQRHQRLRGVQPRQSSVRWRNGMHDPIRYTAVVAPFRVQSVQPDDTIVQDLFSLGLA